MVSLEISPVEAGQRLDKFLKKYLNLAPASFIYKMLRKKNIKRNGKKADGSEKLQPGDTLEIYLSEETLTKFRQQHISENRAKGKLDILYEDENIAVVNKPVGMLSQKAKKSDISLIEEFSAYLCHKSAESVADNSAETQFVGGQSVEAEVSSRAVHAFSPGVCNRLDRNTSGLVVVGKTVVGAQKMSELLKTREIEKYYLCIVKGRITKSRHITAFLEKDERTNSVQVYQENGEGRVKIETAYTPVSYSEKFTLLKVHLITGKSHQIRAHLAYSGHAIIGDKKYGKREDNQFFEKNYGLRHQLLHAYQLVFPVIETPFEKLSESKITAPVPKLFSKILTDLKEQGKWRHGTPEG